MRIRPAALAVMLAVGTLAHAQMPSGAQVVVPGSAVVNTANPNAYVVTQTADKAIINWNSFSIGSGNSVQFVQPGSSSVILNRVVGNDVSRIFGSISANGQVFLVNPNGVYFAPGASIDVGGLVASTLNIRDSDFLSGNYLFTRGDSAARAEVVNAGMLKAREGGYIVLAGDYAANRGVIEAKLGTVMLGSAQSMTLDVNGDSLVNYAMNARSLVDLAGVSNSGQLMADGGRVVMTAMTARSLTATAVNNTGLIQARGVADGSGGSVELLADGSGVSLGSGSTIDVSGAGGGGTVLVGGDYQGGGIAPHASNVSVAAGTAINADATGKGNGGKVVLWSDGATDFNGAISARGGVNGGNGGNVEVSGQQLNFAGSADTRAPFGQAGNLLLDPTSITIATNGGTDTNISCSAGHTCSDAANAGGSILSVATLQNQLGLGNVIVSTGSSKSEAGTITVSNAITWSSIYSLSLVANNQIAINGAISGTNASSTLALNAGSNQGVTQNAAIQVANLVLSGDGNFTLNNSGNSIGTLSTQAQALGLGGTINQVNGNISLTTSGGLTLGTITTKANGTTGSLGTTTVNVGGNVTQSGALTAAGLEVRSGTGVNMTLDNAGNSFGNLAVATNGATTINLGSTTTYIANVGSTSGVSTNGNSLSFNVGTGALLFGTSGAGATTNVGGSTVTINANSSGRVYQYGSSPIIADTLYVNTDSYVGLSGTANSVNTLILNASGSNNPAASTTGDSVNGLAFDFLNNKTLTLGAAASVGGNAIYANNADVKIATNGGNLNLYDGANISVGTGYLALEAAGQVYSDTTSTITAKVFGTSSSSFVMDNVNGLNNAHGNINAAAIAIKVNSGLAYTAAQGLTISSKVFDISGITANGDVYINTGKYAGYVPGATYDTNVATSRNTGLFLDGGINAAGHSVYLNSASGIYQWGTSGGSIRDVAKIVANNLLVTGEGQFSLLDGNNKISTLAAYTRGSFMYGNSAPLTIDQLSFNAYGINQTLVGVQTTSWLLNGSQDTTNSHSIQLSAADDPNGSNLAMDIRKNIVANSEYTHDSPMITLSVAASSNHPDALVRTSNGAMVVGSSMALGAQQGQGSFDITANVARLAAAGGITTSIDDTAYTGSQNAGMAAGTVLVFGLGSSGGGGAQAQVGDVFIQAHGITLTGGQSVGQWLLLRTDALTMLGSMQMADGARGVILQPLTASYNIGVHNSYDPFYLPININYPRSLLQQFSQTTAFYVGSTPQLLRNDYSGKSLPSWVTNYTYSGTIHIGGDADGGLQLGYRSLSAESPNSIWAGYIGNVYNLRLDAPWVTINGFNVTGTQLHIITNNLSMPTDASNYNVVTQKSASQNTQVMLRSYTKNSTIWVGNTLGDNGSGLTQILFPFSTLVKFPDYTNLVISGSTDYPLQLTNSADIYLSFGGEQSLGHRTLTLSTPVWVYPGTAGTSVFGHNISVATWNASHQPQVLNVYSGPTGNGGAPYALGAAGGTWGGCPSVTVCNPSASTSSPGGGSTTGSTTGDPTGTGGTTGTSSQPPAPPPDPTTTTVSNVVNTGGTGTGTPGPGSGNPTTSGPSGGDPTSGFTPGGGPIDTDPNIGMHDSGTGPGPGPGPGIDTGPGTSTGTVTGTGGIDGGPGTSTGTATGPGTGTGTTTGPGTDTGTTTDTSGTGTGTGTGTGGSGMSDGTGGPGGGTAGSSTDGGAGMSGDTGSGSGNGAGGSGASGGAGDGSGSASSGTGNGGSSADGSGNGSNGNGSSGAGAGSDGGNSGASSSGADDGSGGSGSGNGSSMSGGAGSDNGSGGAGNGSGNATDGNGSSGEGNNGSNNSGNGSAGMSGDGGNSGGTSANGDDGVGGSASGKGNGAGGGNGSGQGAGSGESGDGNADASGNGSSKGNGSSDTGSDGTGSGRGKSSGMEADDGSGNSSSRGQGSGSDDSGTSGKGGVGGQSGGESSADSGTGDGGNNNSNSGAGNGSGKSGAGGSSGGGSDAGINGDTSSTICLGQKNAPRNQELPEQGGSLSDKPLVGVRNGGVNMDSDCSRQQSGGAAGASAKR